MPRNTPRSPVFRMADRLLEGRLVERMTEMRAEGLSYEDIARHLFAEAGITTTGETIRSWARQLGIDDAPSNGEPTERAS